VLPQFVVRETARAFQSKIDARSQIIAASAIGFGLHKTKMARGWPAGKFGEALARAVSASERRAFVPLLFAGFLDGEQPVCRNAVRQNLPDTGRPAHLDFICLGMFAQTKIEWQRALREIPGLAVVELRELLSASVNRDRCPQTIPVRLHAHKLDLQKADEFLRRKIAHEDLGAVIHFVGYDVEVAIVIKVEDGR